MMIAWWPRSGLRFRQVTHAATPSELTPRYRSAAASSPIPLWSGRLHYKQGLFVAAGTGSVIYEWRPSPRLRFHFPTRALPPSTPPDEGKLLLWGARAHSKARLWQYKLSATAGSAASFTYEGLLTQALETGTRQGIHAALFHLLNFPDYVGNVIAGATGRRAGRAEAQFGGWHVTLDNLAETKDLRAQLRLDGGYGITHVGLLRRANGDPFTARSLARARDELGLALSFARGGWSHPTLLVGKDRKGTTIWERWDDLVQSPFVYRHSWMDATAPGSLPALVPGFIARCRYGVWREPMRRATVLYVDANQQSRVEVGIVLAQVALELLAWALLVLDQQLVSRHDFDQNMDAAGRIRKLLAELGIPVGVPAPLTALGALAGPASPGDGPQRIAFVRNRIIHPPKRIPAAWPDLAPAVEANYLGLEFLELALLKLSDYRGKYWSRCAGATKPVPWP